MKRFLCTILLAIVLLSGFQGKASANAFFLPAQLDCIEEEAFYGDRSITEVVIPNGATRIDKRAFAYSGLNRIEIPDSVNWIAEDAFDGLSALTVVCPKGSYAYHYVSQHEWITWENSSTLPPVADDTPLTRESILALLDAIDPDGAYIVRNSSDSLLMAWFGSAATIGEGLDHLSTAVHEQCHSFCGASSGFLYSSIQSKYIRAYVQIYTGNGQFIRVPTTDIFPSSEMVGTIPESLKTFRFDTYIDGDPLMGSIQYGVYGMLDEFTAYCWGNQDDILQENFRSEIGRQMTSFSNSFLAYAEFRYYILHYMLYAREHYPDVYADILDNDLFRQAFSTVDRKFAGFAEKQKNIYSIEDWNALMDEMAKPEYVKIANQLKP